MQPRGEATSRIAFRHAPPDLGDGLVTRARLIATLRGRFERRLTVISAGAGFGKTTLLSQALQENRLDHWGTDVWLRIDPADRDGTHLLAGVAQSLTGGAIARSVTAQDVADKVWALAPEQVALVIDDTHLLAGADAGWSAIEALLGALPANGHLVLAGRTRPELTMAKLVLDGEAQVLEEQDLAFTAEETAEFRVRRGLADDLGDVSSWPALAVLQSTVGRTAPAAFIWEEVLAPLAPARLRLLALAAHFDVVDDQLVAALDPTASTGAAGLVADLPLVQADGQGSFRLHALLAAVLRDAGDPADTAPALSSAAQTLLRAGADRRAIEAAAAAGDDETLHRAICQFFTRPIRVISIPDVVAIDQRLPPALRTSPLGCFLDAARHWESSAREAIKRFERAEAMARDHGDDAVEALAAWRLVQLEYLEDHALLQITPRHLELAARGVPLASSVPAFVRSVQCMDRGDVEGSIAALDDLDDADPDQRRETVHVRMFDLGRPEAIAISLEALLTSQPFDNFGAQGLWVRGEVPPEAAWAVVRPMSQAGGRTGVRHEEASFCAVAAQIALRAGDDAGAAQLGERASSLNSAVGTHVRLLTTVSGAVLLLSTQGEEAAIVQFRQALAMVPLGRWPTRPYLFVLASLRALVPETFDALDAIELGPALTTALDAGRALAELRATGDVAPAAALPWHDQTQLRCQVPPSLLTELALAAELAGAPGASEVLAAIAHPHRWFERIAATGPAPVAQRAQSRIATLPVRPGYTLELTCLGGFAATRSDGQPVDASRTSRARVRQILARLVLARRVPRQELAASLWPDLPAEKASTNLRVNLRHLQDAFQPDRGAGGPTWFVQADNDAIWVAGEGIDTDVWRFDDHIRRASDAEANGLPSVALSELRNACELYGGDLFGGVEDLEVELERSRLRSLALSSRCRVGELILARGEPETAMHDAVAALRLEPLSERAQRLFIRCHLAVGSTTTARDLGVRLAADLRAAGLDPERETEGLLRQLQVE